MNHDTISRISNYRNEIMEVAILLVVFYSGINFPNSFLFNPFILLKTIGYGGADLFFFLSGFGLFYGWSKAPAGLLLNAVIMIVLTKVFHINYIVGQILATGTVLISGFIMNSLWMFGG